MSHVEILHFDTQAFPFRALVEGVFGVQALEDLHRAFPEQSAIVQLPDRDTDDQTYFHKRLYQRMTAGWPEFEGHYQSLVRGMGRRLFPGEPFIYQHRPRFSVHLPGSLAVAEFHRDRDYNHPLGEINFMVPLTPAVDTSAMWIESEPGKGNYRPVNLQYGDVARFDGNRCVHGNKVNATGKTRISFDFRLLSVEDFLRSEPKSSLAAGLSFTIGGYYRLAARHVRQAAAPGGRDLTFTSGT